MKNSLHCTENTSCSENLAEMIGKYCQWMELKNYTQATLRANAYRLGYFMAYCDTQGISNVLELTREVLKKYQSYLETAQSKNTWQQGRPLSASTKIMLMSTLLKFTKWLAKTNLIVLNPGEGIYLKEPVKSLHSNVPTHKEVELILSQTDITTPLGIRDRAILETFYSTGIRVSELIALKLADVDLEQAIVMVIEGKGRKDRIVPIGQRAIFWLEKYLREVRHIYCKGQESSSLFLSIFGRPFSRNGLSHRIGGYIKAANIGKAGSCHIFRHAMASAMLENGAEIHYIQEMLGHASLSTTEIYTNVCISKLKQVHNNTHPGQKECQNEA